MKKFHYNIVLFCLTLLVVIIIIEQRLSVNTKTDIDLKYEEVYYPKVNANMIVFGNSHAGGIDPAILENEDYNVYNFYFGGCSPLYYRIWYNEIFKKKYPKPKYLIYVVDWAMMDSSLARRFEVDIRLVSFSTLLNLFINEPNLSKIDLITKSFYIVTNRKQLHNIFYPRTGVDVSKYYRGAFPANKKNPIMGESPKHVSNSLLQQSEFVKLLNQFKKDDINVIFVSTPEYIPSWRTTDILESYKYFEKHAEERNIPYLNYNKNLESEINYDSTYFNDWVHLNEKGAKKFSEMLSSDLQKLIK